ncbi:MAG: hypothetical protein WD601_14415 [Pseudohongiellaceae bacterium]
MIQDAASPSTDEIFLLFEISAGHLAKSSASAPFLDWIASSGPVLAPTIASGNDGPPEQAFRAMGVSIYNAMPLPGGAQKNANMIYTYCVSISINHE